MAEIRCKFVVLAGLLSALACGGPAPPRPLPSGADRAPTVVHPSADEIAQGRAVAADYLVAFTAPSHLAKQVFHHFADEHRAHYGFLADSFGEDHRVQAMRFLSAIDLHSGLAPVGRTAGPGVPTYLANLAPAQYAQAPLITSLTQVTFRNADEAKVVLAEWQQQGRIVFAEPNYVSQFADANLFQTYATNYQTFAPNDWWLDKINLIQAYQAIGGRDQTQPDIPTDAALSSSRPLIAVLDSGIDYDHPALKANIWTNTDTGSADCDNDLHGCNTTVTNRGKLGNGDVWPFSLNSSGTPCTTADDNCSHGTHVAGLIAADASWSDPETAKPVGGVCPVCQIMILKIVSQVGNTSGILDSSIIAAFKYVTLFRREGSPAVRVVNASFGKFVRSRSVGLMIRLMRDNNGAVLVGAAGNEDTITEEYPAAFADAISVAAVDSGLEKDSFSNYGRWVDLAAPGDEMRSTVPGSGVAYKSGTSMATPMVAGVAGLVLARYPGMSYEELRGTLLNSANPSFYAADYGSGNNFTYYYPLVPASPIRQPLLGAGFLDAAAAVNRQAATGLPLYSPLDRVGSGCSTVHGVGRQERDVQAAVWLLLVPLLWAAVQSLQVKRAMLRKRRSSSP